MPKKSDRTTIFTDGACHKNPGPGGWGALIVYGGKRHGEEKAISGNEIETTNNRMELTAAIKALEHEKKQANKFY